MMSLACAHSPSKLGCPSGVRAGVKAESSFGGFRGSIQPGGGAAFGGGGGACCADTASASTKPITIPASSLVMYRPPRLLRLRNRRMKRVVESEAIVFEQLKIRLAMTVENHAHSPRPGKHLRVLDGHFVGDVIAIEGGEPLDQVQCIAVEVAGAIEPGILVEIDDVDHQRVAFPAAA